MNELSDDDIDALLLLLFNGSRPNLSCSSKSIRDLSHDELLRIRSKNHPDKWPNVNQAVYQSAVEELDRRRRTKNNLSLTTLTHSKQRL